MSYDKSNGKVDLVLDIETIVNPVTQEELDAYLAEYKETEYKPHGSLKDPIKMAQHRDDFFSKEEARKKDYEANAVKEIQDKRRFSLGGKRMISCAIGCIITREVRNIESWASDDLSVITQGVVNYFNDVGPYRLVGYNSNKFDLPELCKSFHKTKHYPNLKPSKWDCIDLMHNAAGGLKEACKAFGITPLGVTGEAVAAFYEAGEWDKIEEYNRDDVRITGELYIALSSLFSFY